MIRHVAVEGARLAVREWTGESNPLVALHPGVGDHRIWTECADLWAAAGHHVVAYDRRGFGETTCDPVPHRDVDDLDAVVQATCGTEPVALVGNSRGGGLALDYALAHPDRVDALVLVSPSPSGYPYEDWVSIEAEETLEALIETTEAAGDLDEVNRLEVRYWLDGVQEPEGRVGGAARALMLEMNGRALVADPIGETLEPDAAWPRLGTLNLPVLVAVGEHDLPGCHDLARQLVEIVTGARLEIIRGSAHCPSLDQPAALAQLVSDWIDQVR